MNTKTFFSAEHVSREPFSDVSEMYYESSLLGAAWGNDYNPALEYRAISSQRSNFERHNTSTASNFMLTYTCICSCRSRHQMSVFSLQDIQLSDISSLEYAASLKATNKSRSIAPSSLRSASACASLLLMPIRVIFGFPEFLPSRLRRCRGIRHLL